MASEILAVPEDHLEDFLNFLDWAVNKQNDYQLPIKMGSSLKKWIKEEKKYLKRLKGEEE